MKSYREEQRARANSSFPTDDQLKALDIAVTDAHLVEFLAGSQPSWTPTHAKKLLAVAKALRTIFVHHFGKPNENLQRLLDENPLDAIRISNNHVEVLIPIVRDVSTVVQGRALIIERRRNEVYV